MALEPRHPSWFEPAAERLVTKHRVARVAADPAVVPAAAEPGGWDGLVYYRLHGSPKVYYSAYPDEYLEALAKTLVRAARSAEVWCIFDVRGVSRAVCPQWRDVLTASPDYPAGMAETRPRPFQAPGTARTPDDPPRFRGGASGRFTAWGSEIPPREAAHDLGGGGVEPDDVEHARVVRVAGLWGIPSGYRFEPPAYFANAISGMVPPSAVQIPL